MRPLLRLSTALALALVGLAGCTTGRVVMTAPDGFPAIHVRCRNPWNCEARSRRICPGGHQVVSTDSHYWLIRCAAYHY